MAKQVTRYFIILFQKLYKEAITMNTNIYPRTNDLQTVYLNAVINNPHIKVGDYTIYNDFVNDPVQFEKNNVLYHYPVNGDRLIIGKFCSIACGAKFLFNSANHTLNSLSNYPFPIFFEEWQLDKGNITSAWDNIMMCYLRTSWIILQNNQNHRKCDSKVKNTRRY